MKKIILSLTLILVSLVARADYDYLKFTTTSGAESTISSDELVLTFADGVATVTSGDVTKTFTLADLASMEFTDTEISDYSPYDVNRDTYVNVGDVNEVLADILAEAGAAIYDVNGDGEVNVGDVNDILSAILAQEAE